MSTQPPSFGATPPDYGNQGQVPQAPPPPPPGYGAPPPPPPGYGAPPPTYGAPPPGAPGAPPSFGAPPPAYSGAPPPQKKGGFSWWMGCLIALLLSCCCCGGGCWAMVSSGSALGKEFMDGFGDELRKTPEGRELWEAIEGSSSADTSSDPFATDDPFADSSGDTFGDTSSDGSGDVSATGTRSYDTDSPDGTEDAMRIGYWIADRSMAGDNYTTDAGYNADTQRAWMSYILTDAAGNTSTYTFEYDTTTTAPIPIDDNARQLAQDLRLSRKDG